MNNRDYKNFAPKNFYHIYNRGNNKQNIFIDQNDYLFFLLKLCSILGLTKSQIVSYRAQSLPKDSFTILSYCLMPNHFHILIRQNENIPIGKLMSKLCTSYSKYFNKKYARSGALFQDQFKSIIVSTDSYLFWLTLYIHLNPVRAFLAIKPQDYKWSSYYELLNSSEEYSLVDQDMVFKLLNINFKEYRMILSQVIKDETDKKSLAKELLFDN
ncbi:MAG: transposase [bacterium]|nr:transposase [bacterium]